MRFARRSRLTSARRPSATATCGSSRSRRPQKTGAEAIHPGYGLLSEREAFAQACADEGIIFIGPPPSAIRTMGDKQAAREAVKKYNVPVVPGTEPGMRDDEIIAYAESQIGFPLIVKAAAGGGGKGMRAVHRAEDLPGALATARREAESAFGDGTIYAETLLVGARHIEFQILADTHGNVVHLGERDCSMQRRHQKLVEEAPSPFMDVELRRRMGDMAIAAARSVGYVNAGTIECLVDKDKKFYFLEMNTRLQVDTPSPNSSPASIWSKNRSASRVAAAWGRPKACWSRMAGPSSAASTPKTPTTASSPASARSPP